MHQLLYKVDRALVYNTLLIDKKIDFLIAFEVVSRLLCSCC
jgi:hypothetical protein